MELILIIVVLLLLFGGGGGYWGRRRGVWWPERIAALRRERGAQVTSTEAKPPSN